MDLRSKTDFELQVLEADIREERRRRERKRREAERAMPLVGPFEVYDRRKPGGEKS